MLLHCYKKNNNKKVGADNRISVGNEGESMQTLKPINKIHPQHKRETRNPTKKQTDERTNGSTDQKT